MQAKSEGEWRVWPRKGWACELWLGTHIRDISVQIRRDIPARSTVACRIFP